jgi:hypothetical protein
MTEIGGVLEKAEARADVGPKFWPGARIVLILAMIAAVPSAMREGLAIRRQAYQQTSSIRFTGDISNGYYWGRQADEQRLLWVYDNLESQIGPDGFYELDYAPLRLTVVEWWYETAQKTFPGIRDWEDNYELTRPMLRLNIAAEIASSALIFLLIRLWTVRMDNARRLPMRGVAQGIAGAMLFWFNPAMIWDDHCWPQWDVWLVPFFLAAVLLASCEWWFAAGICVVMGAFLKGQILLVTPIFIFWPLFQGKFASVLRFAAGFVLAAAIIALPWMHLMTPAWFWLVRTSVAIAILTAIAFISRVSWKWIPSATVAACIIAWPAHGAADLGTRAWIIPLIAAVAAVRLLPGRLRYVWAALVIGICVFLTIPFFGVSTAWFTIGFEFGTKKFPMIVQEAVNNVPRLMQMTFRSDLDMDDPVPIPLLGKTVLPFGQFMQLAYLASLVLCGFGAVIQARRRDTRFLMAFVTPWLFMFLLLPQMNCRYLIWAAAMTALLPGVDWGVTLLGILVSLIAWAQMAERMLMNYSWSNRDTLRMLEETEPQFTWMLLLIAIIFLYVMLAPRPQPK